MPNLFDGVVSFQWVDSAILAILANLATLAIIATVFPICTLGEGDGALSLRHCQLKLYRYENHDFHHAPSAFR